jgi:hypothetical protein
MTPNEYPRYIMKYIFIIYLFGVIPFSMKLVKLKIV